MRHPKAAGADRCEAPEGRRCRPVDSRQGSPTTEEAGATLADLLRRPHRIPARVSAEPADRVLHLDLHPDNVMLTPGGAVVIDWGNTQEGPPGLDWGRTRMARLGSGPCR
ncbi:hypothetical protein GCM10010129_40570 [Streptomyces fumigatiscleroticus]|nr:hypothetical protein GCM10010129_40570 [Streptomyces fumigatiscleroticus]